MVLTDRQRADLHAGIQEYLNSRPGEAFQKAAQAFAEADPEADRPKNGTTVRTATATPLLEKKWTAIPRLQKKVLELERHAAQNAKIHAHRAGSGGGMLAAGAGAAGGGAGAGGADGVGARRMLPRLPCQHTLQGHSLVVTSVAVHPVFTVVASGSEDGTIKVRSVYTVIALLVCSLCSTGCLFAYDLHMNVDVTFSSVFTFLLVFVCLSFYSP
jgi:platelet-activating factor acetylhydrolase IB subunit alpha